MAFSLSSWFKGKPGAADAEGGDAHTKPGKESTRVPNVPPPAPAGSPPPSVRTVLPNSSTQRIAPVMSLRTPGAPPTAGARPPMTRSVVRPPARKVSFPVPSAATPHTPVAVAPPMTPRIVVPAPVPQAPDTTVTLELGDFIDRLPPGFLVSGALDRQRTVDFRADELYSDLAKGRASVPASTIYAKCPDIFARPVTDTEDTEVSLPLQKLVEQLSAAFQTRQDQVSEEPVGEIETPFLQVAMEDNARLPTAVGTIAGAIRPPSLPVPVVAEENDGPPRRPAHRTGQISTISQKPSVEPPPAPTFAPPSAPPINPGKRPPSTVRASVAGGKIRLSGPAAVARMVPSVPPPAVAKPAGTPSSGTTQRIEVPRGPAVGSGGTNSPSHQVAKKTARIQIPPISLKPPTGGTNTPKPPSMPPPPSVPVQSSPVSIHPPAAERPLSFRSSPPRPPSTVKLPPPSFAPPRPSFPPPSFPVIPPGAGLNVPPPAAASPTPAAPPDDRKIELNLAAVLRAQPSSALAVEPEDVPDSVRFSLPFGLIEKQLSTGRVTVPLNAFNAALPEEHRHVLATDSGLTEVQIPLQEVFQNLPGNALTMRQDQIIEVVGDAYPTPFSQKAAEDAERLGVKPPVAPPQAAMPAEPVEEAVEPVESAVPVEEPVVADAPVEAAAPAFEELLPVETAPVAEEPVVRDVPLDLDETLVADESPESASTLVVAEEPPASKRKKRGGSKVALTTDEERPAALVTGIHPPEDSVVEPPAAIEPPPVAEALAMLESTAPGEEIAAPEPPPLSPAASTRPRVPAVASTDTELQTVFMTEDELDAKGVVRHVCLLPGINGCAVMFADGLRLAGNFPDGDTEGFSAMAPPFFKRTGNFTTEADLGKLLAITLHTDRGMFSFFMHEDICLSVRHTGRGFLPGVREKLEIVTRELARMYATEKPAEPSGEYTV